MILPWTTAFLWVIGLVWFGQFFSELFMIYGSFLLVGIYLGLLILPRRSHGVVRTSSDQLGNRVLRRHRTRTSLVQR